MRSFNSPRAIHLRRLGLAVFLGCVVFACVLPIQAARRHRRSAGTGHHAAQTRVIGQNAAPQRGTRKARPRRVRVKARRRQRTLETRRPAVHQEIAESPLEHFRWLPPLRGSRESLLRQNERAEKDGLAPLENDAALISMSRSKELVALPVKLDLRVDPRLEVDRRYCRPWTGRFLSDLAQAHYARFHSPLQVNSAVRTVEYQKRLVRVNGNAAPAEGDTRSPHLTGEAIDIAKKGLSQSEVGWLRAYLMPLQSAGKLDVEEEFEQACFHISVYRSYSSPTTPNPPAPSVPVRARRRHAAPLLASRLP
jgi:hypothetical protein